MKPATCQILLDLPVDVLISSNLNEDQLAQELRETLALKLFAEGRLSGGKAAKLAGMSRAAFLFKAGQQGIDWLPYSKAEVRRELDRE
jgi:predicted HTH domain antitoxin